MSSSQVTERSLIIVGQHGASNVEWTVTEYARVEKVDPRTVKRWIAKGALNVRRTPGGHLRIKGSR